MPSAQDRPTQELVGTQVGGKPAARGGGPPKSVARAWPGAKRRAAPVAPGNSAACTVTLALYLLQAETTFNFIKKPVKNNLAASPCFLLVSIHFLLPPRNRCTSSLSLDYRNQPGHPGFDGEQLSVQRLRETRSCLSTSVPSCF